MAKIKDIPTSERPREKALRYGVDSLTNYELLAMLISSGCKDKSALDIAYEMLDENGGLVSLVQKPFSDLINYKGMGKIKAVKLVACFELARRFQNQKVEELKQNHSVDDIYQKYKLKIMNDPYQEHVFLIVMNRKREIVHEVNLYKGTEESVDCSSIEIIRQVLIHNGKCFYLVHNHPSGFIKPSAQDVAFTTELIKACEKVKIKMLDHIIISLSGYYSFKNSGAKNT